MIKSSTAAASYAAKLRDPRWQKKRLEVLELAGWVCQMCGDGKSTLHVHHKQYLRGFEPWDYDTDQLASLCAQCHENGHGSPDVLIDVISRLDVDGFHGRKSVAEFVSGFVGQKPNKDFSLFLWHIGNIANKLSWLKEDAFNGLGEFLQSRQSDSEKELAKAIAGFLTESARVREEVLHDR